MNQRQSPCRSAGSAPGLCNSDAEPMTPTILFKMELAALAL